MYYVEWWTMTNDYKEDGSLQTIGLAYYKILKILWIFKVTTKDVMELINKD